ncbi:hypothetical protein JHS3_17990 [Jeongeupia sp. HS-3]|uniref:Y-family DNA polymerase n=1 Tax=Jeongeupia sp. HS-3 TaxID=1009682 RepID=UPI0018A438E6|nr:DNA polymerase Y family protein [Jeongeupia sp. HS-3]BCL76063.1 hypothetical protein JHS3_17990 [Jeongeupia sp. HS-3]
MLWLALHLPTLALDVFPNIVTPPKPRLVVESAGRFERVVQADALAQSLGIRAGIKLSAALALANELTVHRRNPPAEAEAMTLLACWAQQFTPTAVLGAAGILLLEIGGCLRYFGGLAPLQSLVVTGLAALGHTARMSCAPTPLAASWRVAQGQTEPILDPAGLLPALAGLPLSVLPLRERQQAGLAQLGVKTLGELLALPRAGIARRFGADVLPWLDRALGVVADPREAFVPPDRFSRCIDLDYPFEHVEVFIKLAERLCTELAAYLAGRGLGVQSLTFRFAYEDGSATLLEVGFGRPIRRVEEMLAVLRERAERFALTAPVCSLTLEAERLHALGGMPLSLFDLAGGQGDVGLLLARLRARLGDAAVSGVATVADHRPERAWAVTPTGEASGALPVGERPGWLLPEPLALPIRQGRPWHDEPLSCIGRAERIEAGWWDGGSAVRDYFQAVGPSGRRYWIYQDRHSLGWYLHGLF